MYTVWKELSLRNQMTYFTAQSQYSILTFYAAFCWSAYEPYNRKFLRELGPYLMRISSEKSTKERQEPLTSSGDISLED